jgi:predicted Mrr-cat superfamily restriction endonuclease
MTKLRAWKFRPGSDENVIRDILNHGTIRLDYGASGLRHEMTRVELTAALRIQNPNRSNKGVCAHAGQLDTLFNRVKKGDLALVPRDRGRLMMVGEIVGDRPSIAKVSIEVSVRWITTDVPLARFDQDLQYSFMAIHKFCEVSRNGAPERILMIAQGMPDPGY